MRLKNVSWFWKQGKVGEENWLPGVVEIKILGDNDKVPELLFTSVFTMISGDSVPLTVVILYKTQNPGAPDWLSQKSM